MKILWRKNRRGSIIKTMNRHVRMLRIVCFLIVVVFTIFQATSFPEAGENYFLCVANEGDKVISVEMLLAHKFIPVGEGPHGIQIHTSWNYREKYLWVANRGKGIEDSPSTEESSPGSLEINSVWMVDLYTNEILARMPVGQMPAHIGISYSMKPILREVKASNTPGDYEMKKIMVPHAEYAFVSNEKDNNISIIAISSRTVIGNIPVGIRPHALKVAPSSKFVGVANMGSADVSIIDAESLKVIKTVKVGGIPTDIDFSPDGKFLFVSIDKEDSLAIIRCSSWAVVDKIPVRENPTAVIVSRPLGRFIYVACSGVLCKINPKSRKEVATIPIDKGSHHITINHEGDGIWISNEFTNTISEISPGANQVVHSRKTGKQPQGIAYWY